MLELIRDHEVTREHLSELSAEIRRAAGMHDVGDSTSCLDVRAALVAQRHPAWPGHRIAREVGCSRRHLYRLPLFRIARARARAALKCDAMSHLRGIAEGYPE